jgi:hypothetical protein
MEVPSNGGRRRADQEKRFEKNNKGDAQYRKNQKKKLAER